MADRSDIDQMTRLIELMNGKTTPDAPRTAAAVGPAPVDAGVAAMKAVLESLRRGSIDAFALGADRVGERLFDVETHDIPLRQAMLTEQTATGVQVGGWEIRANMESGRKLFDVIRVGTGAPLAVDLTLYEAALGLAQALDDGLPITSKSIRALLLMEGEYANAVHDAIHSKSSLRRHTLTEARRSLLEDKYGAALRRADDARRRIKDLVTRYPN